MAGNQSSVCMVCGGGYSPNLIVSNCWKSILCVCIACRRRIRSKPDCIKCLEINPMCAWFVDEGTVQTRLCQMAGNQFYVCAWDVKEGTVQTWLFQMAGNQSSVCMVCGGGYSPNLIVSNCWKSILCVCIACRRRIRSKPDCIKCLEINPMCAWFVDEGTVQTRLCQMAGNQFYVCAWDVKEGTVQTWLFQMAGNQSSVCMVCGGGYSPNLTVSNGWKSSLCVYKVCEGGYRPTLIVSNGWK